MVSRNQGDLELVVDLGAWATWYSLHNRGVADLCVRGGDPNP